MQTVDPIKPVNEITEKEVELYAGKLIVQRKYNGCRCTVTIDKDGINLWSRSLSTVTGQRISYTGKMPHIVKEIKTWNLPNGTMLDGELVSFRGGGKEYFKDIKQATGGHDETNVVFQESTGYYATLIIFDVIFYNGQEVANSSLSKRLNLLDILFKDVSFKYIELIESWPFNKTIQHYKELAKRLGIEGYVVKNLDSLYKITYSGKTSRPVATWWKMKPERLADVIVLGYENGKTGKKNQDKVGKLVCFQYDLDGNLHQVCKVGTGFSDSDRVDLLKIDYSKKPIGIVQYAYRNENHIMIHPSWKGFRETEDKSQNECVIEELL